MTFLINLIVFLIVLSVIVLIHEAGHLLFAKRAGILCHEYSIGMGPLIYQKEGKETQYSVRAIPLGGYVSMAGEAVSDSMFKKDDTIGLIINGDNLVEEILLYEANHFDVKGVVKSFDMYGKDMKPLFVELETAEGIVRYEIKRNAKYRLSEKSWMWVTPAERSFESKSLWQRFLTIFAGPLMNFILAFVLFFIVGFFVLEPNYESNAIGEVSSDSLADLKGFKEGDLITSINGTSISTWYDLARVMGENDSPIIDITINRDGEVLAYDDVLVATFIQSAGLSNVNENTNEYYAQSAIVGSTSGRAASAGLSVGDEITKINGEDVSNWDDIINYFKTHDTTGDITVTYLRDGNPNTVTYELISEQTLADLGSENIVYQIGVGASGEFDLGYSLLYAPRQLASDVDEVFTTIGLLFGAGDSNIGIGDLSGPVGIFQLVSNVRENGFASLIIFMGFLSINIGILNLLPIPALDGGRIVFLAIEAIIRRPLNRKVENTANLVMFFALMGLIIYVSINDVMRLVNG